MIKPSRLSAMTWARTLEFLRDRSALGWNIAFPVLMVAAFVRGLEASLATSGDPRVAIVHSLGASENIENSTIPGRGVGVLAASLERIEARFGEKLVSPELYLGSEVTTASSPQPTARRLPPAGCATLRRTPAILGRGIPCGYGGRPFLAACLDWCSLQRRGRRGSCSCRWRPIRGRAIR